MILGITDPIVVPLEKFLEFLHDQGNLTYGWAIVVLTVIVRLAISPLYIRQIRSMRKMQAYAPEMKELRDKYKNDRQKQQEELMRFYKENDINPFSSCLPILLQAPVFIGLFYALSNFAKDVSNAERDLVSGTTEAIRSGAQRALDAFGDLSFMWAIDDVSEKVQQVGWGLVPLLILYGLSQLLSFEVSSEYGTTAAKDRPAIQKWLFRIMPIPITLFVWVYNLPAGLLVYWVTTNLWTCGQAVIAKKILGPVENLRGDEAPKGSRTPPKPKAPRGPAAATASLAGEGDGGAIEVPEAEGPEDPEARDAVGGTATDAENGGAPPEPAPNRPTRATPRTGNRPAQKGKGGQQSGGRRRPPKKGGR